MSIMTLPTTGSAKPGNTDERPAPLLRMRSSGFCRIRAIPSVDWMPNDVMDHLDGFLTEELGHVFWEDAVSLQNDSLFDRRMIRGHKQLTDIYLLGLAFRRHGRLATFDRSIPWQAVKGADKTVLELLQSPKPQP